LIMGPAPATNRGTAATAFPYSFSTDKVNEQYLK